MSKIFNIFIFSLGVIKSAITPKDKRFEAVENYCINYVNKKNADYAKKFLARIYFDFQRYDLSVMSYMDVLNNAALSEKDINRIVVALYKTGKFRELIGVASPLTEKYKTNYQFNWHLGRAYYLLAMNDEAVNIYTNILKTKSDKTVLNDLALIYMKEGLNLVKSDIGQAETLINKAMEMDSSEPLVIDAFNVLNKIKENN